MIEVCEWPHPSNEVPGAGSSLHVLHSASTPGSEDDGLVLRLMYFLAMVLSL